MFYLFLILLLLTSCSKGVDHIFLNDDEDIFVKCPNSPPGVLGHKELFDFSEFKTTMNDDFIDIEGNLTTTWDIQPTDRVEFDFIAFRHEFGSWQPTVFSIRVKDFCKVMYDNRQYWYTYWTQYVTNPNEVAKNCINVPGTKLTFRPYNLHLVISTVGPELQGRYKVEYHIRAYDKSNKKRPTSFCFYVSGQFIKIK